MDQKGKVDKWIVSVLVVFKQCQQANEAKNAWEVNGLMWLQVQMDQQDEANGNNAGRENVHVRVFP